MKQYLLLLLTSALYLHPMNTSSSHNPNDNDAYTQLWIDAYTSKPSLWKQIDWVEVPRLTSQEQYDNIEHIIANLSETYTRIENHRVLPYMPKQSALTKINTFIIRGHEVKNKLDHIKSQKGSDNPGYAVIANSFLSVYHRNEPLLKKIVTELESAPEDFNDIIDSMNALSFNQD